ncbi:hypothetical protein CCAX7_14530 [Capsulimonas corticalis]|uniref:Uncharacterized protein n=1 Tax=Capsulimonas corticalis TaxID=2219043 RepID=A0A402CZK6_9BACT|nr:phage virion morphogenesis protein [Capsulimonas corticalis]BDI29402.1 hypothetical protein CCAX7_14530 [Capsulimonas corticalis]
MTQSEGGTAIQPAQTVIFSIVVHPELIPDGDVEPLMEALAHLGPVLDDWGLVMARYQQKNFDDKGATFGYPWEELAVDTVTQKQRLGYPDQDLVRKGRIASEIGETILLTPDSVTTGINIDEAPEAYFHQFGRGVPQRILVALVDAEIDEMYEILRRYIAEATGGSLQGVEIVSVVQ